MHGLSQKPTANFGTWATDAPQAKVDVAPASFSQERMWFLHEMWPNSGAYNVPAVLHLKGDFQLEHFQCAVDNIVQRHETLRTNFEIEQGQILQFIYAERSVRVAVHDLSIEPEHTRFDAARDLVNRLVAQPFDLSRDPLVRFAIVQLAANEHLLVVVLHHIIADEWSMSLLFSDLATEMERASSPATTRALGELPIQYADYAVWQREQHQQGRFDDQLQYWKEVFATPAPVLQLPFDRARPSIQTTQGAHITFEIDQKVASNLLQYARSQQATVFMVIVAAYQVLLQRFSGQNDIVVGCPIANRNRTEFESLIGLFLNTVMIRCQLSRETTFRQLLSDVRQATLAAFANQDVPFERLVEELRPERDASHSPLFQTMVTFQNAPFEPPSFPNCDATAWEPERGSARFDLSLYLEDAGGKLLGEFEYNSDLFDHETIERLQKHFVVLLCSLTQHDHEPVSCLDIIPSAEKKQILIDWNGTQTAFSQEGVIECISRLAQAMPTKTALFFGETNVSYETLERQSDSIAGLLQSFDIGPGDLVGICLQRSADMVIWLLGILKSGAAYVPIDPAFPEERQRFIAKDSGIQVLVTQDSLETVFHDFTGRVLRADVGFAEVSQYTAPPQVQLEDPAYVIYTSGSTGNPKGVVIPHRAMRNFLYAMRERPGLQKQDRLLAITTLSFDISVLELFLPLVSGASLVVASREDSIDGRQLANLLETHRVSVMQGTPATWQLLIDSGWQGKSD
ncbi:MAG: AMP-binding protein, partial [Planctomycetales bacterium]|nr:AMP-binding protein [Planctomycetales bacterium]